MVTALTFNQPDEAAGRSCRREVRIAEQRADLGAFATLGFPGHAVTGNELAAAITQAVGHAVGIERMRWWLLRSVGRLMPMGRELAELEYLWRVPHRVSGEARRP